MLCNYRWTRPQTSTRSGNESAHACNDHHSENPGQNPVSSSHTSVLQDSQFYFIAVAYQHCFQANFGSVKTDHPGFRVGGSLYRRVRITCPWARIHNLAGKRVSGLIIRLSTSLNAQRYIAYAHPDVKPPLLYSNSLRHCRRAILLHRQRRSTVPSQQTWYSERC